MRKNEIKELISFLAEQNRIVMESIDPNKSDYNEHCRIICLLQMELLEHILYCIDKEFDLEIYKENNQGNKFHWFGISD